MFPSVTDNKGCKNAVMIGWVGEHHIHRGILSNRHLIVIDVANRVTDEQC